MEIVLVRHAQPDWEPGGRAVDNPDLTELGRAQAECVARELADETFDAIYVSPLERAAQTAAPLLGQRGIQGQTCSWLREMGMPVLDGQTSEQIQAYFEKAYTRELEQWWDGMPGGERFDHFYERVSAGLETLLVGQHAVGLHEDSRRRLWQIPDLGERILIVAHEGTNAALICYLLGVSPVPWIHLHFSSNWGGLSRVHSVQVGGAHMWSLECFNRVDHLRGLKQNKAGRSSTL